VAAVCPRCRKTTLSELSSPPGIAFFSCPTCRWEFAKRPDRELCDRWNSPISLLLYPIQFDHEPIQSVPRVVEHLLRSSSHDEVKIMIREVRRELETPTQEVRNILNLDQPESTLRDYLRTLVTVLERHLHSSGR
jgi:hypothetical protein